MAMFKKVLINLLVLGVLITDNYSYASSCLRIELGIDKTKERLNSVMDNKGRFIFSEKFSHRIIVFRNHVKNMPKGQVCMRVCEISDLSELERIFVANAFSKWLTEFPGPDRNRVIHPKTIKFIIDLLTMYNPRVNMRIYVAISYPEVNGKDTIDVEGFSIVTGNQGWVSMDMWEIKPDNRDGLVNARYIPKWFKIPIQRRKDRFLGVGNQILSYTIWREMQRGCEKFMFRVAAKRQLSREGFSPSIWYDVGQGIAFMKEWNMRNIKRIEKAAEMNDAGARGILADLNKINMLSI